MKKYSLKKSLVTLTLTTTMTFQLVGCTVSGTNNSNKETTNQVTEPEITSIVEEPVIASQEIEPEETPVVEEEGKETYPADKMYVLDTTSSFMSTVTENSSKYYFLIKTGEKESVENYVYDVYKDIFCEEAEVLISEDKLSGMYFRPDTVQSELVDYVVTSQNEGASPLLPINTFLVNYGLEDYIDSAGKYSSEDIGAIREIISSNEKPKEYKTR